MFLPENDEYFWSSDARLVRRGDGNSVAVNFSTGKKLIFDKSTSDKISQFSGITIPFTVDQEFPSDVFDKLVESGFLIARNEHADHEKIIRDAIKAVTEQSSGLIVMPTEKCNLRCTYCYESFERGRMRPEHVEALVRAIEMRVQSARNFSLGFFGGEPLLCSDIVLRLSEKALVSCLRRGIGFGASISTNAVLVTPDLFEQLIASGMVFFQVTLDGARDLHDRQRVTVKGKGTFDKIVENLAMMAATRHDFAVALRCNVHAADGDQVLKLFESEDLAFVRDDPRFTIDVHYIWKSDRQTLDTVDNEGCMTGLKRGLDRYVLNSELSARGLKTISYDEVPGILANACYAGKKNWFVVGSDLSLYKCTVVFDNPKNRVGRVALDGSFIVDEQLNDLWTGSNATTDAGCSSCYLRVPCGGLACPLSRFTTGTKSCLDLRDQGNLRKWAEGLSIPEQPNHRLCSENG